MGIKIDFTNARVFEKNIMVGNNSFFKPHEPLTYLEAMKIIKRLGGSDVDYDNAKGDEAVSYSLWLSMLEDTLEKNGNNIEYADISIFATGDSESIEPMTVVTDKGIYKCSGLCLNSVIDKTVEAYIVEDEIVLIKNITSQEAEFSDVYISKNDDLITAQLYSAQRKLKCALPHVKEGNYNIKIKNGEIKEIYWN